MGRPNQPHRASGLLAARAWFRRLAVTGGMALAALGLAGATAPLVHAASTITVTTLGDPSSPTCPSASNCSLRGAIGEANSDNDGDTISLPAGSYHMTQGVLTSITASMSFVGASAQNTVINGTAGDAGPLFIISGGTHATVGFSNLTILDADNTESGGNAGAVYVGPTNTVTVTDVAFIDNAGDTEGAWDNDTDSTTTMTDVTFSGNEAVNRGGAAALLNVGSLTLTNVTIADNVGESGSGAAGGILNEGTLSITNSDIVGNIGDGPTGGVWLDDGTVDVVNSIISGNTQDDVSTNDNCNGTVTTTSHDIEDGMTCGFTGTGDKNANPDLGTLGYNGGPLETEALLTGSPAINAGLNASCPTDDERGYVRITASDPICDIGAYEYDAGPVGFTSPSPSGVPVPTSGAAEAGAGSVSPWAVLLLIAGLLLAATARLVRRRGTAV